MAPGTLEKIKLSIRRTHNKLDADIEDEIKGCLADLKMHGIVHKDDTDPLILNAVKLWCKASTAADANKAAEFHQRYIALRDSLKSAKGYGWREDSDG